MWWDAWERRSHTLFIVTRLENVYFYSDFLRVAQDIA